jgi:hypothetical protein
MEDLIKNDATFEVFANSEGAELLDNRVLLSYPSEKSSFDVFLGVNGYSNFEETTPPADAEKRSVDPEKIAQGITATTGAISSVASTIQAFKGDGTKAPSRRKQLKEVCGNRPILKKNREGEYDKCVANYNAGKIGNVETRTQTTSDNTPPPPPPATDNKKRNIIIGVVVVGLLATAFIGYKKGWFGKQVI